MELVGLSSRLHHLPSQLSGGQQQRVAIARVLAGDPRLILADEPTGNLDTMMSREVMDLLERINEQGTTIVMVTHAPECAARASREIHLLDGKVVDLEAPPRGEAPRADRLGEPRRGAGLRRDAMLLHNLRIAWKSLQRNRVLSALIVVGIALGIARLDDVRRRAPRLRAATRSRRRATSSATSAWTAGTRRRRIRATDPTLPPTQVTYRDMVELMKSKIPARQTGMFKTTLYVFPDPKVGRPFKETIRLCFADFFPMFDVPFRYGSGWDAKADAGPEPVVVLSEEMNEKLFGGANSVGKTVRLEDRDFRVVGVLDAWTPSIKFYDLTQNQVAPPENIFIPFDLLAPDEAPDVRQLRRLGAAPAPAGLRGPPVVRARAGSRCGSSCPTRPPSRRTRPSSTPTRSSRSSTGRFPRPLNNRLSTVRELMDDFRDRAEGGEHAARRLAPLPRGLLAEPRRAPAREVPRARAGGRRAARARREPRSTSSSSTSSSAS